ncbi:ABC transporter substrate-binding protein [Bradyrhizobium tropiciagri]|uniref:ABC transporter substrate-binding protein n=1 Tax=Bradyrhizobium tropiciagri TaxID=312253 RepID=UPI001BA8BEF6|nr:ABC transporter substrate-binding protein [Bradyrhizobium tropiciagri]MBR0873296.1 ABC transporter substrate-binding protein [Bradyrhizobium tropiciagri]
MRYLLATCVAVALCAAAPAFSQVSNDVVKIGVLNDQSGLYADLSGAGSTVAAKMAVEDFGGTVLGKPIELISADHQNKPDVGSTIARRWIDTEKVDAIVDVPHSATALAVLSVTREKQKVLLLSGPAYVEFTGKDCSPTTVHWTYDSYAMANGTARAMVKQGGDSWFFLTGDNAGSHSQEREATAFVQKAGGTVVGNVRHPLNTSDFSSYLLQAQQSKAKVIGLANAGGDTVNAIKQANEFGLVQGGQKLAGLLMFITDVKAVGLDQAKGLVITDAFYWDTDDRTREWSRRFMKLHNGRAPTSIQAGVYGAVLHYLKAVQAAGTDEGIAVTAKMKELPVRDFFSDDYRIRQDGRLVRDMYLLQVKAPQESKEPWDIFKVVARIPGDEAYRPMAEGRCPLVKQD